MTTRGVDAGEQVPVLVSRLTALAALGLWVWNLLDAWPFLLWARECYAESQSINAHNDYMLSIGLLSSGAGAIVALAALLIRSLLRRPAPFMMLGATLLLVTGAYACVLDGARPIHLLPRVSWPALVLGTAICLLVAASPPWAKTVTDSATRRP